jgi:hypothetical protein
MLGDSASASMSVSVEARVPYLDRRSAMRAYFVGNRFGYRFPHPISIFRNLAWRLLILELWARAYQVSPHAA